MELVEMDWGHVAQIAELEERCFSCPWSETSVAAELENPLSLWLVAQEDDGRVLGYVGSQTVLDEADMMNVAVAPEVRGMGIATRLLMELEARLMDRGVRCLTLEVRPSNQGARRLYEALGYREIGRRPNYYVNPKEDALILRKEWEL